MVLQSIALVALLASPSWEDPHNNSMEAIGDVCMALAVFSEARGEPLTGQLAIVEVMKNRLKDLELGADGCTVVTAVGQFHGLERWPYPRQPEKIDATAWKTAQEAVASVMSDGIDVGPCKGSRYFFRVGLNPAWASKMTITCQIGQHVFLKD